MNMSIETSRDRPDSIDGAVVAPCIGNLVSAAFGGGRVERCSDGSDGSDGTPDLESVLAVGSFGLLFLVVSLQPPTKN